MVQPSGTGEDEDYPAKHAVKLAMPMLEPSSTSKDDYTEKHAKLATPMMEMSGVGDEPEQVVK